MNCDKCDKSAADFGCGAMVGALLVGVVWLSCDQIVAVLVG